MSERVHDDFIDHLFHDDYPTVQHPWAIVLCQFSDMTSGQPERAKIEKLFTSAGNGSLNMVDFFSDVSHGKIDIGASEVFGWYTLPNEHADYAGNVAAKDLKPGQFNRDGLVQRCRGVAVSNGVDFSRFVGVVYFFNGSGVELFGSLGQMTAVVSADSVPSQIGQEMLHGYGLDHARIDGSTEDYTDRTDIMSTLSADMSPNAEWGSVGPGLCASSMRALGWLDESRVWKNVQGTYEVDVDLRPLYRHDLEGYLAAELGDFLVEYRERNRWDAGTAGPGVLVHYTDDNQSYVMKGTSGRTFLYEGDGLVSGRPEAHFLPYIQLEVVSISATDQTARVHLSYRPVTEVPHRENYWVEQTLEEGSGFLILGGKVTRVPPQSPILNVLHQVADYAATSEITDVAAQTQARRGVMESITNVSLRHLDRLTPYRTPAGFDEQQPEALMLGRTGDDAAVAENPVME